MLALCLHNDLAQHLSATTLKRYFIVSVQSSESVCLFPDTWSSDQSKSVATCNAGVAMLFGHTARRLCDKLHNPTRLLDLSLSIFAEVSRTNDEWDLWNTTLAEDFAVTE